MLTRLTARNYKSLKQLDIRLPRLTVLFGPNSVGKSNILDAMVLVSRLATARTVSDAVQPPVRGYSFEQVTLPSGGLEELLQKRSAKFSLGAEVTDESGVLLDYRVELRVEPPTGRMTVADEYLARVRPSGTEWGNPAISAEQGQIRIRREGKQAHPYYEPIDANHTQLSNERWSGERYSRIQTARELLSAIRAYYLDPRVSMREGVPPQEVDDIGALGESLAPFLFRLKNDAPKKFRAVERTLRAVIPSVSRLDVRLDSTRGLLDLEVEQDGIRYSSRVLSEGTLRVIALCAIAANPWPGSVVAFEEPENGVHPRRLELVAQLLYRMAMSGHSQVVVTSHSPLFCQQILNLGRERPEDVSLLVVRREGAATVVEPLAVGPGALLDEIEVAKALEEEDPTDDWFQRLLMRGWIDA